MTPENKEPPTQPTEVSRVRTERPLAKAVKACEEGAASSCLPRSMALETPFGCQATQLGPGYYSPSYEAMEAAIMAQTASFVRKLCAMTHIIPRPQLKVLQQLNPHRELEKAGSSRCN